MGTLILTLVLIPSLAAVITGLTRKKISDGIAIVAASLMLLCYIVLLSSLSFTFPLRNVIIKLQWISEQGVGPLFGYQLDPLGLILLTVVVTLGFLNVIYGIAYLSKGNKEHPSDEGKERHHFWMFLFIASMIGVAISPNFFQLYIFWEMTTLCSWALISHYRNEESLRAGFKALLMTFSGGLFFAIALVIIFVHTKSFEFSALSELSPQLRSWVFFFFLIAAWAKSAQVPFYTWLPDAMAAPTTVSMYLHAAAMVKAGVFLIARIALANTTLSFGSGLLVGIMAVVTMLLAVFLFFYQTDLKRLLAYSTIAHLGYILFGVSLGILGSSRGFAGGITHIINHGIGKGLLFLCVGAISYTTGTRNIRELSGLAKRFPLTAIAFFAGMLAILGIPPFSGFWSKFYLLMGTIDVGGTAGLLLLIPFFLEIIVAFGWFMNVGQKVFFGQISDNVLQAQAMPFAIQFVLFILTILTIIAPFWGLYLIKYLTL